MKLKDKYIFKDVEGNKYQEWKERGYFEAEGSESRKIPFSMVIPPPNVTGKLHLGHAWNGTIQDIIARYKRLDGYDTLWLPGMDHAGIATQARVDERLKESGISRYDIGRNKFMEYAWGWKEEYAGHIRTQWESLGLSLDYSRERFTLDDDFNHAVNTLFIKLYEDGLLYRGERIINWDVQAKTALSNIEVEHKEVMGHMYTFKYRFVDSEGYLEVSTTRPETMFGDVCIVVNPDDVRYQNLIGKKVINPANKEEIPIIADEYVDVEFGTGAMKCTPAHDPNDFEIGERHQLELVNCMNEDGSMNEKAHKYEGMDRFVCRKALVEDLKEQDDVISIEEHLHQVGHSERTGVIVEPILSKQWFVKMKPLANEVLKYQADETTKINFYPKRFEKELERWLLNIEDWCISRQIWWGHEIPAWYHKDTDEIYVGLEAPEDKENWVQDQDVLDTWFSSSMWPFATLGWPNQTEDLDRYYPNSTLVTAYDIIFFWVARMAFMGRYLTDSIPFQDVVIHGLIRDSQGRKMSKSLDNGVDPIDVIEEYGIDALRFFLATNSSPGQDIRYIEDKVEAAWNFINKLWNASRFVFMNIADMEITIPNNEDFNDADLWIMDRFNETLKSVSQNMSAYEFALAGNELYHFVWDDYCDWYIELSKTSLQSDDDKVKNAAAYTLKRVLSETLIMLHPFIPYVSEEIYSVMHEESIMKATWPETFKEVDKAASDNISLLIMIIKAIREIRVEYDLKPSLELDAVIKDHKQNIYDFDDLTKDIFRFIGKIQVVDHLEGEKLNRPFSEGSIELLISDIIDYEEELNRLKTEQKRLESEVKRSEGMLSNKGFVDNAPKEKVQEEEQKLKDYQLQLQTVTQEISELVKKLES